MTKLKNPSTKLLSKAELAAAFQVSLPTIDSWLRKGCPYDTKGGHGRSWKFRLPKVIQWREGIIANSTQTWKGGHAQPEAQNPFRIYSEESVKHFAWWLTETWWPAWSGLLRTETKLSDDDIRKLFKQQYYLLLYYLDEYLSGDEFSADHKSQTGYSFDDLATRVHGVTVKSRPPAPDTVTLPIPCSVLALFTDDERATLAAATQPNCESRRDLRPVEER